MKWQNVSLIPDRHSQIPTETRSRALGSPLPKIRKYFIVKITKAMYILVKLCIRPRNLNSTEHKMG